MKKFGLNSEQVRTSLEKFGNNTLSQPPRDTFLDKLLDNFKDPIIRILLFALLVNVVFVFMGHGDWIETCGIFPEAYPRGPEGGGNAALPQAAPPDMPGGHPARPRHRRPALGRE